MNDADALLGISRRNVRPGWPVDPFRIRRALWSGRYWLIATATIGVLIGLFWAKVMMGNAYEMTVVLKYEGDLQIEGVQSTSDHALAPAAQALHRESVLRRIRERAGLNTSLIAVAARVNYDFDMMSRTMNIHVHDRSPDKVAEFSNLVTDVFLTYHRERQARRIEQEIERVASRLAASNVEAEEARRRYNEFRERHGIANLSSEQQSSVDSAAKLRADSEVAAAELRGLEAQVKSLQEQLAKTPKTALVTSGTSPEREAYNRLRQELASARASLSPEHPKVQALQIQVEQLRAQMKGGGESVVGRNATYQSLSEDFREAKSELTVLRERHKGLVRLAASAQERIEAFSGIEGEASALAADVKVNEALVSRLRGIEAALEDGLENPPSGFSVLDQGSVPELPLPNKMKKIMFLMISMIGFLLGLSVALLREFRRFRPQTPAEIAFWGHGPVLGTTTWPAEASGLEELVAGLDDLAPDARGELLIIGGTQEDSAYAQELARRMTDDWFAARPVPREQRAPHPTGHSEPLQTPPPHSGPFSTSRGPYPVGNAPRQSTAPSRPSAAPSQPSTALALRPVQLVSREEGLRLDAWDGPFEDQALRRAARLADRVVLVVRSDSMSPLALNGVRRRVGRDSGIGYIVLGIPEELRGLPDRVGNVTEFWVS